MQLKEYAGKTDQGPYLHINEDGFDYDIEHQFGIILDGFGGSNVGPIINRKIIETIMQAYHRIVADRDATLPFFYSAEYFIEVNAMINALMKIHQEVYMSNQEKPLHERGGASVSVICRTQDILSFISVGNCRSYLFRENQLHLIATDRTFNWVADQESPLNQRSIPLRGIGLYEQLNFSTQEVRIQKGDQFLMLTDGVYGHMENADISEILKAKELDPYEKIENFFDHADNRGNKDNQTALFLAY